MSNYHCKKFKGFNENGNILISDQFNNRVIEVTPRGKIVWQYGGGPSNFTSTAIVGVNDAQRVCEKTLMAGTGIPPDTVPAVPLGIVDNRVILVDKHGNILWQYGQFGITGSGFNQLNVPTQCTFVPFHKCHDTCCKKKCKKCDIIKCRECHKHHCNNDKCKCKRCCNNILGGTVLITDQGNNRVIQVNEKLEIVWSYPATNTNPTNQLNSPNSAEKLCNGHVLIADEGNNRAIEVDLCDKIVKTYTAMGTLGAC